MSHMIPEQQKSFRSQDSDAIEDAGVGVVEDMGVGVVEDMGVGVVEDMGVGVVEDVGVGVVEDVGVGVVEDVGGQSESEAAQLLSLQVISVWVHMLNWPLFSI